MTSESSDLPYEPFLKGDYRSQLDAVRSLLYRTNRSEDELLEDIRQTERQAVQSTGTASEFLGDRRDDLVHYSIFQDAAHSMAAVSMIAPALESAFKDVGTKIGRPIPRPREEDYCNSCGAALGLKIVTGGTVVDIMKMVDEEGIAPYLPDDLRPTLQAIFEYRNKMLHCGFEWPEHEIQNFSRRREAWTEGWFGNAFRDNKPWMFYMSRVFISHCLAMVDEIIEGLGDYLVDRARSEIGKPPLGRQR